MPSVYFVDSPGAEAFHYYRDCQALKRAEHEIVEEGTPWFGRAVVTEIYGQRLHVCSFCEGRVEREEEVSWEEVTPSTRSAPLGAVGADGGLDGGEAPGRLSPELEQALVDAAGSPDLAKAVLAGEVPTRGFAQYGHELRVYVDRLEIDPSGLVTFFSGGLDVYVIPFRDVLDVSFKRSIPIFRRPYVEVTYATVDGGQNTEEYAFGDDEEFAVAEELIKALLQEARPYEGGGPAITASDASAVDTMHQVGPEERAAVATTPAPGGQMGASGLSLVSPPPGAKYPIIFIPGTGGSYLKVDDDNTGYRPKPSADGSYPDRFQDLTVWGGLAIAYDNSKAHKDFVRYLSMQPDGKDRAGVYPAGQFTGPLPQLDFYASIMNRFRSEGWTNARGPGLSWGNGWLDEFPYDFRSRPEENARRLDIKVNHVLANTGARKVIFVSHSQGGLVARTYIKRFAREEKVKASITAGTPWLGVVKVMRALGPHGWNFEVDLIDSRVVSQIARNWPAVYAMLPGPKYFDGRPDGFVAVHRLNGPSVQTMQQQLQYVREGYNGALYDEAGDWRRWLLDGDSHGVEQVVIAGDCVKTLSRYHLLEDRGGHTAERFEEGPGDDTVPLNSAIVHHSLLGSYQLERVVGVGHASLYKHAGVQDAVMKHVKALQRR